MFDEHNQITEIFRMARDRFQDLDFVPIRLRVIYGYAVSNTVSFFYIGIPQFNNEGRRKTK